MENQHDFPRYLVLDGGLATHLESRGHCLNDELWSARILIDAPEEVLAVHRDYLNAGADIISSVSYQATIDAFQNVGLNPEQARQAIQKSIELARAAIKSFCNDQPNAPSKFVAASVGPYGAYLANGAEYTGDYDIDLDQLIEFHDERWQLLQSQNPDLMLCETTPSFPEVKAYAHLAKASSIPVWVSLSCQDGATIADGTVIREVAEFINHCDGISGIGINCTSPKMILDLIKQLREVTNKRLIVYPNSGETYDAKSKTWRGENEIENFAQMAALWLQSGASVIGGCCRTTPQHISALRKLIDANC